MNSKVSLKYLDSYEIANVEASVKESFLALDVDKLFKPKMKVLIKVCLPMSANSNSANTTHPAIIRGVVNVLNSLGVECILADCPYNKYNQSALEAVYINSGMLSVANNCKCELNRNLKTCKIETPLGEATKSLTLLDAINEVDAIINLSKLKMDEDLGYIGSVANLFGLVPGEIKTEILNRMSIQKDFNNYCIDIERAIKNKVVLNIMDAVVTKEADGNQRLLYCLAMSENIYNLDAVMLQILNVELNKTILKSASDRNIFDLNTNLKTVNANIQDFKVEDYALAEIDETKKIHKKARKQLNYFKQNQRRARIDPKVCKGCSVCSKICPTGAILMKYDKNGELYASIDYSKCIFCFKCFTACPYSVVQLKTPQKYKKLHNQIEKYNHEKNK